MSDLVAVAGGVVLVVLALWLVWVWIAWWTWRRGMRRLEQEDRAFWLQQATQYDALADVIETAGGDARWLRVKANECRTQANARNPRPRR